MNAVHVQLHTVEQVQQIIGQAHDVAVAAEAEGARYELAFRSACELLGARATAFLQPQTVPLDLSHLTAVK